MRRFRRFFALLFILSIFVGVVHELEHKHTANATCEVCLFAHSPLILDHTQPLVFATDSFELHILVAVAVPFPNTITAKSRAPPLFS